VLRDRHVAGRYLTLALTLLRLLLAPIILVMVRAGAPGWAFAAVLIAGFLSDVFDGVVARATGVATASLRRLDSAVDTVFYLAVAYAAWRLHPEPLFAMRWPIALILFGEGANHLYAIARFHREPSYHAWSAKAWGLCLFAALVTLFALDDGRLLAVAIVAGLVAQLEVLMITFTLPTWRHDVPTVFHAIRLRGS
jgi:CDP-diacylglycerol--glycerol-3-phosphate 3-phosphatidyltransferase